MSMLVIFWNANPEIIELFGISVRWYSLFFALAFLGGYYLVQFYSKKANLAPKVFDYWLLYMIAGAVIGARLGHCLFYEFDYYSQHPLEVFQTWKGGLASHGGAIGLFLALWIFSYRFKISYIWILDRISAAIALGSAFIRMGNLMNSEIFGYPTDMPWGFVFLNADADKVPRHPTQIYEALSYLLVFVLLHFTDRKYKYNPPQGLLVSILLIGVFGTRFLIEFLKERQVDFENSMALDMGQWLSIPFIFGGIAYLIYLYKKKKHILNT